MYSLDAVCQATDLRLGIAMHLQDEAPTGQHKITTTCPVKGSRAATAHLQLLTIVTMDLFKIIPSSIIVVCESSISSFFFSTFII